MNKLKYLHWSVKTANWSPQEKKFKKSVKLIFKPVTSNKAIFAGHECFSKKISWTEKLSSKDLDYAQAFRGRINSKSSPTKAKFSNWYKMIHFLPT